MKAYYSFALLLNSVTLTLKKVENKSKRYKSIYIEILKYIYLIRGPIVFRSV